VLEFNVVFRPALQVERHLFILSIGFERLTLGRTKLCNEALRNGLSADEIGNRSVVGFRKPDEFGRGNSPFTLFDSDDRRTRHIHLLSDGLLREPGCPARFKESLPKHTGINLLKDLRFHS
jgi:hypothetical protein